MNAGLKLLSRGEDPPAYRSGHLLKFIPSKGEQGRLCNSGRLVLVVGTGGKVSDSSISQ